MRGDVREAKELSRDARKAHEPHVYPASEPIVSKERHKVTLPGRGAPGAGCGVGKMFVCTSCGYEHEHEHQCRQRQCPRCRKKYPELDHKHPDRVYHLWALDEAFIMRARCFDFGKRLHHVVISFDDYEAKEGEVDVDEYKRLRKRCYEILRFAGSQGGVLVWHPYREREPGNGEFSRWRPHFHAIVDSRWLQSGNVVRDRWPNVVFKRTPGDLNRNIARFYYLLDHCGVIDGLHTVTWFGSMSTRQGKGFEEMEIRSEKPARCCPRCGSESVEPLVLMDYTGWPAEAVLWGG